MTANEKAMSPRAPGLTVFRPDPVEAGKGGKGGVFQITNADFVAAVFPCLPEGAFAAVSSKSGDPRWRPNDPWWRTIRLPCEDSPPGVKEIDRFEILDENIRQ